MVSEAPFFLGLSVRGLFMTGNCSRTWLVTTSCRYGNSSLTPLKIDPLHPWDRKKKSKKIKVGEGLFAQLQAPRRILRCSDVALGVSLTAHLRAERAGGRGSGRSTLLGFSSWWGHWRCPCPDLVCLILYRLNHRS